MFRIKLPTNCIFPIFPIIRTDGMAPFCNLFMERPSYLYLVQPNSIGMQSGLCPLNFAGLSSPSRHAGLHWWETVNSQHKQTHMEWRHFITYLWNDPHTYTLSRHSGVILFTPPPSLDVYSRHFFSQSTSVYSALEADFFGDDALYKFTFYLL